MNNNISMMFNNFGIKILRSATQHSNLNVPLPIDLYRSIHTQINESLGNEVLKLSVSSDNFMRYKNGKLSSIIKNDSGSISKHEGFDLINTAHIVDSIFIEVNRHLNRYLLQEFNVFTNQVLNSIHYLPQQFQNILQNAKRQEYIETINSYQDFFSEIYEDIGEISISEKRAIPYLASLVESKKEIYKMYNYFISQLESWILIINLNSQLNFQDLRNDFYLARQAISCYMIVQVYEYIISGNIDNKSKNAIIIKIENFLSKFNNVKNDIENALKDRYDYNQNNNFYNFNENHYRKQDAKDIRWYFQMCRNEQNFEISKIEEVFSKAQELLENVVISEYKE